MYTSTLSFMVAPSKNMEANEYFHNVVRQVKKITGTEVRILNQIGGPVGHFLLSARYETLNEWEQARTKLQHDMPFQKLVAQAGNDGLFIPGSVNSALWQQLQ